MNPVLIDPNIRSRAVPTTGSTYHAFSPGFQIDLGQLVQSSVTNMTSFYFMHKFHLRGMPTIVWCKEPASSLG